MGNSNNQRETTVPPTFKTAEEIHAYYQNMMAFIPNNIYWVNRECRGVSCNINTANLLGLRSVEEYKGLTYEDMARLAGDIVGCYEAFKKADLEVMATGIAKLNIEEPPIKNTKGEIRYYLTSRAPVYDKQGNVTGVVALSTDITESKKIEATLRQAREKAEAANQAKIEFLKNMRRDIYPPISGIISLADLIKRESINPQVKEHADSLLDSSKALLKFLNQILEVARVLVEEVPLLKQEFSLRDSLDKVIKLNHAKATEKGLSLVFDYDSTVPLYVIGDPVRTQRIVLELLVNALNFTTEGYVKLTVQLAKKNKRSLVVKLTVTDTGIGMSTDQQREVFTRFKCQATSDAGVYPGTGSGLAIIKQFIDDLKAEIYVESQVNQGTSFTCLISLKQRLLEDSLGGQVATPSSLTKLTQPLAMVSDKTTLNISCDRQQAEDPSASCSTQADELFILTGAIVDQARALEFLGGDAKLAEELLALMLKSLEEELPLLQQAYQRQNWETIEALAHKVLGGTRYCGTVRLEQACIHLQNYLRTGSGELADALYQQLVNEIKTLRQYYQGLID